MAKNWYNEYKKETRNAKKRLKQYPKDSITVIRTKDWYKEYKREYNKAKRRAKRLAKYNFTLDDIPLPTTKGKANSLIKKLQKVSMENYKAGKLPDIIKHSYTDTVKDKMGREFDKETIRMTQKQLIKLQKSIERENTERAKRGLEPRVKTRFYSEQYLKHFISRRSSAKNVRQWYKERDQRAVNNLIKSLRNMSNTLDEMKSTEEAIDRINLINEFLAIYVKLPYPKQVQVMYEFFFDEDISVEVFGSSQDSLTMHGKERIRAALEFIK